MELEAAAVSADMIVSESNAEAEVVDESGGAAANVAESGAVAISVAIASPLKVAAVIKVAATTRQPRRPGIRGLNLNCIEPPREETERVAK